MGSFWERKTCLLCVIICKKFKFRYKKQTDIIKFKEQSNEKNYPAFYYWFYYYNKY